MSNVIIPREHQSAPKEHWADKEIEKAAEEISEGRYIAEPTNESLLDGLGLSLGAGIGEGVGTGQRPTLEEMQFTREMNELGRHPRVVEALEKMKFEIDANPESSEAMEASWKLHEMNERSSAKNKCGGQDRWEGRENEEMRYGQILSPQQFYQKLTAVIGETRILMSSKAWAEPGAKSGRVPLYVPNPDWRYNSFRDTLGRVKANELKTAAESQIVKARKLRAAHANAEADRAFDLAGDMIQAATEIHLHQETERAVVPQFLRVGMLQWPFGTEWMLMRFNEYGVPTTAKYLGWRTALLTMVRHRAITEDEANEAFPVGSGPAADWYLKQLYMRRNTGKAGL